MSECYSCGEKLTDENRSDEHIILNACGGRLSSEELLCKECNNHFGSTDDAELARQTSQLANILHVKRDRNTPPDIKATVTSSGERIIIPFEGALAKVKPVIEDRLEGEKVYLTIEARDLKQFEQIAKGLKRKYPGLPLDRLLSDAQHGQQYLNDSVSLQEKIGGEAAFRAVAKAAVNFFIFRGGDRKYVNHLLPYLKRQVAWDVVRIHVCPLEAYSFDTDEVSHILKLVGDPTEGILYCHIEYFNAQTYLVKLNDDYDGPPMDETYIYDVVANRQRDKALNIRYRKADLISIFKDEGPHPLMHIQQRYGRVVAIAQRRSDERYIDKLSRETAAEAFKDLPEGASFTEEDIKKFAAITGKKFAPFIMHKQMANQKMRSRTDLPRRNEE